MVCYILFLIINGNRKIGNYLVKLLEIVKNGGIIYGKINIGLVVRERRAIRTRALIACGVRLNIRVQMFGVVGVIKFVYIRIQSRLLYDKL